MLQYFYTLSDGFVADFELLLMAWTSAHLISEFVLQFAQLSIRPRPTSARSFRAARRTDQGGQ